MRLSAHPEMQLFFCTCEVLRLSNTFGVGAECLCGKNLKSAEMKCPKSTYAYHERGISFPDFSGSQKDPHPVMFQSRRSGTVITAQRTAPSTDAKASGIITNVPTGPELRVASCMKEEQ